MSSIAKDLRYAIRSLRHNPGFAIVALLSLALGIGANTTIFSVTNAVLYRPLPFADPDRLVVIHEQNAQREGWQRPPTLATMLEWRERAQSFEQIEGVVWSLEPNTLSGEGEAEHVVVQFITPGALSLLGVEPIPGRSFTPEEAVPGNRAYLISHGLWQRRFGGAPDMVGRTIRYAGRPGTIVGVMPRGFRATPWGGSTDMWVPLHLRFNELSPESRWPMAYARLKPGVTIEQAQEEMNGFSQHMAEQQPDVYKDWGLKVELLHDRYVEGASTTLFMLLGAVGFVLLIACVNVANLLLSRATARQKEIAVRASQGADRWRLLQQLLTESLLLGLLGGAAGIVVGLAGLRIFAAIAPQWFTRTDDIGIDGNVLLFTIGVSLLTGILFGLAPALKATRPDLVETLKEGGRRSTGGPRQLSSRLLVVCEVALALVLLVGAGLMINSVLRLQQVDIGYSPDRLLIGQVELLSPKYRELLANDMKRVKRQAPLFFEQVIERVSALPGVRSAAAAGVGYGRQFRIVGRPDPPPEQQPYALPIEVGAEYFRTLGIPLLRGRLIEESDREGAQWVAVVNETLASRFFPDEDPMGKLLHLRFGSWAGVGRDDEQPRMIVGVVADVKYRGPAQRPTPVIYISNRQHQWEYPSGGASLHLGKTFYIRTEAEPMSLATAVQAVITEVDPDQTMYNLRAETERITEQIGPWRFFMYLYGTFAGLALVLAVVGIYGVISYSVGERAHEFGIRMALGAQKSDVLRQVLRQGFVLSLAGIVVGVTAALGLTRFLSNWLFEVKPHDPLTYVAISILMLLIGLISSYLPARRATTVDPASALRHE